MNGRIDISSNGDGRTFIIILPDGRVRDASTGGRPIERAIAEFPDAQVDFALGAYEAFVARFGPRSE